MCFLYRKDAYIQADMQNAVAKTHNRQSLGIIMQNA
jgi:hypothetical protein